jgi:oxalate decarboxylase/phosphoglucose isomerase-like protein (cupin superfamily)
MAADWKTVLLDNSSQWPGTTRVELDPAHSDARGAIQSLVNFPVKNVSLITSKKGTVRSNHYHKTDWHYMYMLSGSAEYYYRPTNSGETPRRIVFSTGELVFTPPMEDHTTVFLEDSTMVVMSRNPRDQEAYESDVVRVTVVEPAQLGQHA